MNGGEGFVVGIALMIFGFALLGGGGYRRGEREGYMRGWIAGIGYERQRRAQDAPVGRDSRTEGA